MPSTLNHHYVWQCKTVYKWSVVGQLIAVEEQTSWEYFIFKDHYIWLIDINRNWCCVSFNVGTTQISHGLSWGAKMYKWTIDLVVFQPKNCFCCSFPEGRFILCLHTYVACVNLKDWKQDPPDGMCWPKHPCLFPLSSWMSSWAVPNGATVLVFSC